MGYGQCAKRIIKNHENELGHNKWRVQYDEPKISIYRTKSDEIFIKQNGEYKNILRHSDLLQYCSNKEEKFNYLYLYKPLEKNSGGIVANINKIEKSLLKSKCISKI